MFLNPTGVRGASSALSSESAAGASAERGPDEGEAEAAEEEEERTGGRDRPPLRPFLPALRSCRGGLMAPNQRSSA